MTTKKIDAQQRIAELEAENAKLIERVAANRTTKEISDYFVNAKNQEAIAYRNLSETKRHFEQKRDDLLKLMCASLDSDKLTSKQFNDLLVQAVEQMFAD